MLLKKRRHKLTAAIEGNELVVRVPIESYHTSGSGNSKLFAKGQVKIPLSDGKTGTVQLNAYVPMKQFAL